MVLQKIVILLDLFWFKKNKSHFCMEFFLYSQALILKIGSRICIPKLAHRCFLSIWFVFVQQFIWNKGGWWMWIYQWQHHRKERSQQRLYSNWDHMEYIPDRIVYGNICWHLSYRTICCNSEIKGKCTRHLWISDSTRKILIHTSLSDGLKGLVTNDQTELWEKEKNILWNQGSLYQRIQSNH